MASIVSECSHHRGLRCRCDKAGVIQSLNDIVPGAYVRIERGPFADFICTVITFRMIDGPDPYRSFTAKNKK